VFAVPLSEPLISASRRVATRRARASSDRHSGPASGGHADLDALCPRPASRLGIGGPAARTLASDESLDVDMQITGSSFCFESRFSFDRHRGVSQRSSRIWRTSDVPFQLRIQRQIRQIFRLFGRIGRGIRTTVRSSITTNRVSPATKFLYDSHRCNLGRIGSILRTAG